MLNVNEIKQKKTWRNHFIIIIINNVIIIIIITILLLLLLYKNYKNNTRYVIKMYNNPCTSRVDLRNFSKLIN